jgi:hypothetical protein
MSNCIECQRERGRASGEGRWSICTILSWVVPFEKDYLYPEAFCDRHRPEVVDGKCFYKRIKERVE